MDWTAASTKAEQTSIEAEKTVFGFAKEALEHSSLSQIEASSVDLEQSPCNHCHCCSIAHCVVLQRCCAAWKA